MWAALVGLFSIALGCGGASETPRDASMPVDVAAPLDAGSGCAEECADGLVCVADLGCVACIPGDAVCVHEDVARCAADGSGWIAEVCDLSAGLGCRTGACVDLCADALARGGHLACEHWAVDLDNAVSGSDDASARPFGVVVTNPWAEPVQVTVEIDEGDRIVEVSLPGLDYQVIALPRREVDGSSASGSNDGTHTAVTKAAFRIRSSLPIGAEQLNPLDGGGFTSDGSLLLGAGALGTTHTVVSWPQTIADGPDGSSGDFDPTRDDEDLRAFLTIAATRTTHLRVTLGAAFPDGTAVVAGGPIPELVAGDVLALDLGAFDVVNLETRGLNADFTGTRIEADAPIAVFTGSEAGDVPFFETYMRRQCCADHLEEQLPPDDLAGRRFLVGAHLPRSAALGRAMSPPSEVEYDEPFWVRVVPVGGDAQIRTTLDAPHAAWTLRAGTATLIEARESFLLEVTSEAGAVHVLQALPGQEAVGISGAMPGGDPSIVVVPPIERFTTSHVFAVPPGYAFDFVTVLSPSGAATSLDGVPLGAATGPDGDAACRSEALDGFVVWQCQLSFPIVTESTVVEIDPGTQGDGFHEITSTAPVGAILTGFRDFVSYGFPAGFGPSGP